MTSNMNSENTERYLKAVATTQSGIFDIGDMGLQRQLGAPGQFSLTALGAIEMFRLNRQLRSAEDKLNDAKHLNQQLEDKIKVLSSQLHEERMSKRAVPPRAVGAPGDPFIGNQVGSLHCSPPGPISPITSRNDRSYPVLSPAAVPYTPTTKRDLVSPTVMTNNSGPPTGRRHKRTETPEQRFLKQFTNGVPIYTIGIDPQNDRGLIHDFFEEIRTWAAIWTKDLDAQEIAECAMLPDLVDMLAKKSDIRLMLADKSMRNDLITALITRHIIHYAMGEQFLFNSNHPAGGACNNLFLQFANLAEKEYDVKHMICKQQKAIYTRLKNETGHKKWRTWKAEERCQDLSAKIACFLRTDTDDERDHKLSELYVKGYRIGFRLRMEETVKWRIIWPTAGTDLNLGVMVNQTRTLFGDPMSTLTKLQEDPKKFFVRFALTPTVIKSDFSSMVETKTVVHSSLIHVGRKGVVNHSNDAKY